MRPSAQVHDALARLLEYPREGFATAVREAELAVGEGCPEAREALRPFVAFGGDRRLAELEELFTHTFDNTEERALEVGWHAFGENYTRGTFMVRMRQRLRDVGVEENGELPDHLSLVLRLVGRGEADRAADLVEHTVLPAARKVHAALVERTNPWAAVLAAVLIVLERHAPATVRARGEEDSDA